MSTERLLTILVIALSIALAVLFFWPDPEPEVRYREVQVADTVLIREEPDTVVKFVERIVYRTVRAEQIATAPEAALPDIASFCSSAGWVQNPPEISDSIRTEPAPSGSVLLLRSISYDRGDLTMMGPRSDGDLWRGDYRVGPRFQARVMGDSVLVQSARWSWVRDVGEKVLWAAGGAAAGYLLAP